VLELGQDAYRHKPDTDGEKRLQLKADDAVCSDEPNDPREEAEGDTDDGSDVAREVQELFHLTLLEKGLRRSFGVLGV
jgi:hypothetical protein